MSEYPSDWKLIPIREIITESRINPELDDPSKRISVRLHCEGVEKRSERATDQAGATRYYKRLAGQFIYGKQNLHKGAVGIVPEELDGFCSSQDIPAFDITPSVDPNWFLHLFRQRNFYESLENIATGTGSKRIQPSELGEKEIAVPPLPEQKKIAEILSGIDQAISKKNILIEKLLDSRKALIEMLYANESEIDIPLSRVCKCQGGFAFKSSDSKQRGNAWFKIANVSTGTTTWKDRSYLPYSFRETYKDFALQEGDIVLAMTRPIISGDLKVAQISKNEEGALLNQRVGRLRGNEKISQDFLFLVMQARSFAAQLEEAIAGTDPPNVSSSQIESLLIPLPDRTKQTKEVSIISSFNNLLKASQRSLEKIQAIKKSLSADLLSGRKRVSV